MKPRLSFLLAVILVGACLRSPEATPVEEISVSRGGYLQARYAVVPTATPTIEVAAPEETSFTATITWYSEEENIGNGITASGSPVAVGHCASYPGVFPFGQRLFVEGHGIFTVTDTGTGFEDGRQWVDIFHEDTKRCFELGIQERRVWRVR